MASLTPLRAGEFVCGTVNPSFTRNSKSGGKSLANYNAFGERSVLVIRVDFTNAVSEVVPIDTVTNVMASVDAFYRTASFQQFSLPSITVTPVLRLAGDARSFGANWQALATGARVAAAAAGYSFENYDFVIYTFPPIGFPYSGLAVIYGKGIWIPGPDFTPGIVAHELGHNLGLEHACTWTTPDDSIVGPGRAWEYGNYYDVMGSSPFYPVSGFNANYRYLLGWLDDIDVQVAATNGLFRVFAIDAGGDLELDRQRALRVPANVPFRPFYNTLACDYWIDHRQSLLYDTTANGIFIKAATDYPAPFGNLLLDTTPATEGLGDAPLLVGRTFADTVRGIYITPTKQGTKGDHSYIDVVVRRNVSGNSPPTVRVRIEEQPVPVGRTVNFYSEAADPDGDELAYYWDFGDGTVAKPLNYPLASRRWTSPGFYPVRCVVSDMKGGTASSTLVVTVGTPESHFISGIVTNGSAPVQGVRVLVRNNGGYRFAITDSSGFYCLPGIPDGTNILSAVSSEFAIPDRSVVIAGSSASNINLSARSAVEPAISSFSPVHGDIGTSVTVRGVNFSSATSVRFGGIQAEFVVVSPSQIAVAVPGGAESSAISVVTPKGVATSTNSFLIDQPLPIVITRQPAGATIPEGSSWVFSIAFSGTGPVTYQWRKNGTNLPGAASDTLTIANAGPSASGAYSVIVSNRLGAVQTDSATLSVLTLGGALQQPNLTWVISPPNSWAVQTNTHLDTPAAAQSSILPGDFSIETTVDGPARLSFWWKLTPFDFHDFADFSIDGRSAARLTGSTGWENVATNLDSGNHLLRWTRHAQFPGSRAWLAQVELSTLWFLRQPTNVSVLAGTAARLEPLVSGATSYRWERNGEPSGATNAVLVIPSVTPSTAGDYRLYAFGPSASITSVVAQVSLVPLRISLQPTSQIVRATSNITLAVQAESRFPFSVQWLFEGEPLSQRTNLTLSISATPEVEGNYQAIVTNVYGAATTEVAQVTVDWSPPEMTNAISEYAAYTGENVMLASAAEAIPAPTYEWRRNKRQLRNATSRSLALPAIRPAQGGVYSVIARNPFGSLTQDVHVTVQQIVLASQPVSHYVPVGTPLELSVEARSAQPLRYQWRRKSVPIRRATNSTFIISAAAFTDSGSYDVVVRSARGRVVSHAADIQVVGVAPQFAIEPEDQRAGLDGSASFRVRADASPVPDYRWFFNDQLVQWGGESFRISPVVSNWIGGFYAVASNAYGIATSRVAILTVLADFPHPRINPKDFSTYAGDFVVLSGSDTSSPPFTNIYWMKDGTNLVDATNSLLLFQSIRLEDAGKYRLTAVNRLGTGTSSGTDIDVRIPGSLDFWQWRSPLPRADDWRSVAFGNEFFLAGGESGAIATSIDGTNWSDRSLQMPGTIASVAFGLGRFVALVRQIDDSAVLLTSTNGMDWAGVEAPDIDSVRRIRWLNGRFFISGITSGTNLVIACSADGLKWNISALGDSRGDAALTYGSGRYVAIASNVWTSLDGTNWSRMAELADCRAMAFGAGVFSAVGLHGQIWNSTNGTAWKPVTSGTGKDLLVAEYVGNAFIAAGEDGIVMISPDGRSWAPTTGEVIAEVSACASGAGQIVLVGKGGSIANSTHGVAWQNRLRGITFRTLHDVIYTNGTYVAVGDGGVMLASADGKSWVAQDSGTGKDLYAIARGSNGFVAVGEDGKIIGSEDGVAWRARSSPVNETLLRMSYVNDRYLAVGSNGTVVTSFDGTNWSAKKIPMGGDNRLVEGIAYGNGVFVVGGGSDYTNGVRPLLAVSVDGTAWQRLAMEWPKKVRAVYYVGGKFIALCNDSFIGISDDGFRWHTQAIDAIPHNLRCLVVLPGGMQVILGNDGVVYSSMDGFQWERRRLFTSKNIQGAAYGDDAMAAVGTDGAILTVEDLLAKLSTIRLTSGQAVLQVKTGAYKAGRIQASADLLSWRDVSTVTNGLKPAFIVETNLTPTFYRLQIP